MSLSTTATADDLVRTSRLSGSFADNPKTVKSAVAWHAFAAGAAAASSLCHGGQIGSDQRLVAR